MRERQRRYEATEKGKSTQAAYNARRRSDPAHQWRAYVYRQDRLAQQHAAKAEEMNLV